MNKKIVATAACALMALTLAGCGSKAEEPNLPAGGGSPTSANSYTVTDAEKLKALSVGEAAVWSDYEVKLTSVERTGGQLIAHVDVAAHTRSQSVPADCMLYLGMGPVATSFENNVATVAAGETASGTITFDDPYAVQRLFWNDGATEATWLLDQIAPGVEPAPQPEAPAEPAPPAEAPQPDDAQGQAVAAIEGALPSLIADYTYYAYQSFDPATATVTPIEGGGYQYVNDVSVLDGDGNAMVTNVSLMCDATGACTSMSLDGVPIF